jgi:hypothetical protein
VGNIKASCGEVIQWDGVLNIIGKHCMFESKYLLICLQGKLSSDSDLISHGSR